ncbi:MAG: cytotoxic translational repressor of toxin-antitoxin stability system [Deltaproteobacteria bacterium]|nr:cytotoxic translational repressor of toxin-antitoxin stability system [Deltaproteobacteria bacterium]
MWHVTVTSKAARQADRLPRHIQQRFDLLTKELEVAGPVRTNWKNFGRLKTPKNIVRYHCHIKSGHPTYVACWDVLDEEIRLLEINYVGTHENAPY